MSCNDERLSPLRRLWRFPRLPHTTLLVAGALAVGLALRLLPIVTADFPLHDGGLFLTMARDITDNRWALPEYTSYNDASIPFAYPPLGLYVLALVPTPGGMHWLSAIWAVATLAAFVLVARRLLPPAGAAIAVTLYSVSLAAYAWLLPGAGVTRGLGMTLALIGIWFALDRGWKTLAAAGICIGASVLAHPDAGVFAVLSVLVLMGQQIRRIAGVVAVATVLVLPWVVLVVGSHGASPFLSAAASHRSGPLDTGGLAVGPLQLASPYLFPGWMGAFHALLRRKLRLLVWALIATLALPLPSYLPAVTLSLLAGQLWNDLAPRVNSRAFLGVGLTAMALGIAGAATWDTRPPLSPISASDRAALTAFQELPPETTIAIRTNCFWAEDAVGEWAPVLTRHHVTTTVQGLEWLGPEAAQAVMRERESPTADVSYATTAPCR